jgi:hypothetical protein
MNEYMGVTEYARHRGVTLTEVQEAVMNGRISYTLQGTRKIINPRKADVEWASTIDLAKSKTAMDDPTYTPVNTRAPPFQESRAIREAYAARIAKLDYEQKKGDLINKDLVKRQSVATASIIKNNMRQIPIKVAAALAAETDSHKIEMMLNKEIDEALEELSRYAERH